MDPTLRSVIRETKAGHINLSRFMFVCFTSKDTCDGVGKEEDFKNFFTLYSLKYTRISLSTVPL